MIVPAATLILAVSCQRPESSERIKPLLDDYAEAWNTGNTDLLDGVVASGFELRMSPTFEAVVGLDSLKHTISYWRTAFPDFHLQVKEVIFSGDAVATRWTITGTNSGPGRYPPSGKHVDVTGMSIIHAANGKLVDEWISGNDLAWLQQLGWSITPPQGEEK